MSINHITNSNPSADKLDIYVKTINADELKADNITADTVTANDNVTTPFFRSFENKSWSDVSDVALTSSFPVGFISGISGVTYDSDLVEKYDPDQFLYVKTLKIKVRADCTVGLPGGAVACGFYITVYNIPSDFHNATLRFGRADFRTSAGTIGDTGLGLWTVDTSVSGQITFSLAHNNHNAVLAGSNFMDCEFDVRAVTPP